LFAESSTIGIIVLVVRPSAISLDGKKETKVNTRKVHKDEEKRKRK